VKTFVLVRYLQLVKRTIITVIGIR
jgi:hypothetical protein